MGTRAAFYIDGFNLFHAIDDLRQPRLKWFSLMDWALFVANQSGQSVELVRYFSALATFKPQSMPRHQTYLRALKSTGVEYVLGHFKSKPRRCNTCGTRWTGHEEKETDVNIAVQLIEDSIEGLADTIYLVSSDSDLAPAIRVVLRRWPHIDFVTVAPPNRRHASELLALACRDVQITTVALTKNRLPESITDAAGTFQCPAEYT